MISLKRNFGLLAKISMNSSRFCRNGTQIMGNVKKKRKYNLRLIRSRRTYTISELAKLLGVHTRTVQTWHKQGLKPINPDEGRYLFMGSSIRDFLGERQKSRKFTLVEDEFYCPRCRKPMKSVHNKIKILISKKRIGKDDIQTTIKGICIKCGCKVNRFSTLNNIKKSFWRRFLTKQDNRLKGN